MSKNYDFDYIIIGSGPAGCTVATKLSEAHKRVAIVEKGMVGGAEVNTRDLSYRVALKFAHAYHDFTSFPGITEDPHLFNFPTLIAHTDRLIRSARDNIVQKLIRLNITLISGAAHFVDPHTIIVGDRQFTAENFILATGSKLKTTEIAGVNSVGFLTPSTALRVRRLPRYVFIVGGGSTGVEIAEFFASLGAGVIIMERGDHLLPKEDEDVSEAITDYLTNDLGVTVVAGAKVTQITEDQTSKIVIFTAGAGEKMVRVDSIVLATGSEPILDYGLENADVDYKRSGIIVDKYFTTTAKNIFAIGDCLGNFDSSTERACLEAKVLAENLLHRKKSPAKYSGLIRHTDTKLSVATIGMNERDAVSRDLKYKKSLTPLPNSGQGFLKTLTDRSGHFLGTTLVAPHAKDSLDIHKLLTK